MGAPHIDRVLSHLPFCHPVPCPPQPPQQTQQLHHPPPKERKEWLKCRPHYPLAPSLNLCMKTFIHAPPHPSQIRPKKLTLVPGENFAISLVLTHVNLPSAAREAQALAIHTIHRYSNPPKFLHFLLILLWTRSPPTHTISQGHNLLIRFPPRVPKPPHHNHIPIL